MCRLLTLSRQESEESLLFVYARTHTVVVRSLEPRLVHWLSRTVRLLSFQPSTEQNLPEGNLSSSSIIVTIEEPEKQLFRFRVFFHRVSRVHVGRRCRCRREGGLVVFSRGRALAPSRHHPRAAPYDLGLAIGGQTATWREVPPSRTFSGHEPLPVAR
jgi:hypothetical protein